MPPRIGILGGTFDPIHLGHLDLAAAAQRALDLTSVMLIPAHVPPHRPLPATSAFHRFAMVSLALADRPSWTVSDMELLDAARSYTSATLERLHTHGYTPADLYFLIGADAFREIASWNNYPAILDAANFAVVARPGFSVQALARSLPLLAGRMRTPQDSRSTGTWIILIDTPTADVSATAIRARLCNDLPIDEMVPCLVAQHIARHGLYKAPASDRRSGVDDVIPAAGRLHGQD